MKNVKHISINALPASGKVLLFVIMFSGCALIKSTLDTDFYFLYSFGKYIANNGFPIKDVLSMHTDMDIIVQQWLADLLLYRAYELGGKWAILAIVYAACAVYTVLLYRLCKLVTNNFFVSVVATTISSWLMAPFFMVTRPQIFTYLIFVLLLFALEKYVKTRKVRWLFVLPLLSVVQINVHASMWLMLFVLMLPYVVSSVNIKLPFYTQEARCRFAELIAAMVAMVAAAFLNPYGYRALLYLFGSFGVEHFNQNINEMAAVTISTIFGKLYWGILFFMGFLLVVCKKRKMELRFVCLALGTAVLGLTAYKATAYFFFAGFTSFAHYFSDFDYLLKVTETRTKQEKVRLAVLIVLLVAAVGCLLFVLPEKQTPPSDSRIEQLESVVEYLDTQESGDMVLYAGFNEGAFLEFHGYKPYLDARAELFLKEKNGQFDYFSEYLDAISGRIYYKDFLDKYGFTHIVVPTGENHLYISILHDADYEVGYTDEAYTVFIHRLS